MVIHLALQFLVDGFPKFTNVAVRLPTNISKPVSAVQPQREEIQNFLVFLAQFLHNTGYKGVGGQVVHLIGAVKQDVQKISGHQLPVCGIVHPSGNELRFRHRLIFQRHIPTEVFVVPFPALPVPVQLVPFLHHGPEIFFGAGSFLQPTHGLGPNLPFQPLFADWGGFFFLALQFRFIVDGMLILLQLAFQLCQAFFRKGLFQRFFRPYACPIVPSGEATFGIQKLVIRQIRHDPTSFQKNIL